jgi:hypothetical protein
MVVNRIFEIYYVIYNQKYEICGDLGRDISQTRTSLLIIASVFGLGVLNYFEVNLECYVINNIDLTID